MPIYLHQHDNKALFHLVGSFRNNLNPRHHLPDRSCHILYLNHQYVRQIQMLSWWLFLHWYFHHEKLGEILWHWHTCLRYSWFYHQEMLIWKSTSSTLLFDMFDLIQLFSYLYPELQYSFVSGHLWILSECYFHHIIPIYICITPPYCLYPLHFL